MALQKAQFIQPPAPAGAPNLQGLRTALVSDNPQDRRTAAAALGRCHGAEGALIEAFRDEPAPEVRSALITALQDIGGPVVAKGMVGLMGSDDAGVRNGAMEVLTAMPEAAAAHIEPLLQSPDPDTRLLTLQLLSELNHPQIRQWLAGVLQNDNDLNVVASAIEVMAEAGLPEDIETLVAAAGRFGDEPFLAFAVDLAVQRIEST